MVSQHTRLRGPDTQRTAEDFSTREAKKKKRQSASRVVFGMVMTEGGIY